ncbi:hypothetical protein PG990_000972 [Apiospora arundinis]|uniref:Uncharacterized protein n=1 Tax=Apiospora arundinis TaxID=335852 RepID=A0ABR2I0U4_9PEZI
MVVESTENSLGRLGVVFVEGDSGVACALELLSFLEVGAQHLGEDWRSQTQHRRSTDDDAWKRLTWSQCGQAVAIVTSPSGSRIIVSRASHLWSPR